ncbi:lysine-specific histone demethylase 2-like [Tubulanus polymorphus]|uniref:lysine-specific histone demethylase 2-like n=1 Tax=Tubulanus polymorphus TaxID=672921 RepID=UPI003DA2D283
MAVSSGRIKRKSLKLLEAEGLGVEDIFSTVKKDANKSPAAKKPITIASKSSEPERKKLKIKLTPTTPKQQPTAASEDSGKKSAEKKTTKKVKLNKDGTPKVRGAEGAACSNLKCSIAPTCGAAAVPSCCGSGKTSRWYHISSTDHYCNMCFEYFYRPNKRGYQEYLDWVQLWCKTAKADASLRMYMTDQLLLEWIRCTRCNKWRRLSKHNELTEQLIRTYVCEEPERQAGAKTTDSSPCDTPESKFVQYCKEPSWLKGLNLPLLLHYSPAAPFVTSYKPDLIGLSATSNNYTTALKNGHLTKESGLSPYFKPFNKENETEKALRLKPDKLHIEELMEFPEYEKYPTVYLGVRNLVLSLWNLNCKEWLTAEACEPYLICGGTVRIHVCTILLERIVRYLTYRGIINTGVLIPPSSWSPVLTADTRKRHRVVIIGAGAAGLGAARHLQNLGAEVLVLEAQDRIGGRVHDDQSLGVCVGRGAQIIICCINNPFSMMTEQLDLPMKHIREKCDLIDDKGNVVGDTIDRRVDFHFNAMLDIVADWRRDKRLNDDSNLYDKIEEMHKDFLSESQLSFSEEERQLFQFHIGNLEYACGTDLHNVSAIHWDQNERYPQFTGEHVLLVNGYSPILDKLAAEINIERGCRVTDIDYTGSVTVVTTADGKEYKADKVLVTVPVTILKQRMIKFNPELPKHKLKAIDQIGAGIIEKVGLQFSKRFWTVKDGDFFGYLQSQQSHRGLFNVFWDLTPKDCKSFVLMTYISGSAVQFIKDKTDAEVIELCMKTLQSMFPKQKVPEPSQYFVTHWRSDSDSQMAYSYIPVGQTGEIYDDIGEQIEDKIYFAGEATNRQFPQTVTGAYLSGIREAIKITETLQRLQEQPTKPTG